MKRESLNGYCIFTVARGLLGGMLAVVIFSGLLPAQTSGSLQTKPNVLFIVVDDLRPQLGCYGDAHAITPGIDQLASEGTLFRRAYCQQAVCSPSRSSVLTGRRPNTTKVWDLKTHFREALPDVVTLPQYFRQHGYLTRAIGKIYHDSKDLFDPPSWSVPEVYGGRNAPGRYALEENILNRTGFYKARATERADVPDTAYIDGKVAVKALQALKELKDSTFFLAVGFWKPHLPFVAPEKYWALYDGEKLPVPDSGVGQSIPAIALHDWPELRGYTDIPDSGPMTEQQIRRLIHGYYASTSFVDAQIGKLLEGLKTLGLSENTIVVLWGDHGFHLGERGLWTKNTNFELDTRVPLIVSAPGRREGVASNALVELVDLYPTLVALAGLPMAEGLEGHSLIPLLDQPDMAWKPAVFSQFPRPWPIGKGGPQIMGYSVRTDHHRYTEWRDLRSGDVKATELYDHLNDPFERVNVSGDKRYRRTKRKLEKILLRGWREAVPKHE